MFDVSDSAPPSVCYQSGETFLTFSSSRDEKTMRLKEISLSALPPVQWNAEFCAAWPKKTPASLNGKTPGMTEKITAPANFPIHRKTESRIIARSGAFECHE